MLWPTANDEMFVGVAQVIKAIPGVEHRDRALCQDASDDDGLSESTCPGFTEWYQYTWVKEKV